jgi:hypothetical protein
MMAASASKLAEQNVRVIVMRAFYSGDFRGRGISHKFCEGVFAASDEQILGVPPPDFSKTKSSRTRATDDQTNITIK